MKRTGFLYDERYLLHTTGPYHPEIPERLTAIYEGLAQAGLLDKLTRVPAAAADLQWITHVHTTEYVKRFEAACRAGKQMFDSPDNQMCTQTYETALLAVGGILEACRQVMEGRLDNAFCAVRPPGHHAEVSRAMGFCYFNNVAIAARFLQKQFGLSRVGIVDFDVHHGNGTQDVFEGDPRVMYLSTHQFPFYPGTGDWHETGRPPAVGNIVNVPLPRGCGDAEFITAYREICAPAIRRFGPGLILVSAGFDAHFADPLAQELLSTAGYYEIAGVLNDLANELCDGRIIHALEGGYDLTAISWSVQACIDSLLGNEFSPDPLGPGPEVRGPDVATLFERIRELHGLGGD